MYKSKKLKVWGGVRNPEFSHIQRNRDHKGRILTYTVKTSSGYKMEFNTLREARIMAIKI